MIERKQIDDGFNSIRKNIGEIQSVVHGTSVDVAKKDEINTSFSHMKTSMDGLKSIMLEMFDSLNSGEEWKGQD